MKKKLGIFSFVVLAGTMFFNVSIKNNSKTNGDLASLIATSIANAEVNINGCRVETDMACQNGSVTVIGCDDSWFFEVDNCWIP